MKLHLLGVNGPFPESGGATSGYLLQTEQELLQFDLGSGVLARLTALAPPESLSALFLSHWHFDHISDLPVLMYRLEAMGETLRVFAPVDESSVLRRVVASASCFQLNDIVPGQEVSVGGSTVLVCEARHPVPAVGYRVKAGSRVFGYTGDTNSLPELADRYRGCHLLLADGLFPEENWSGQKPHLSAALAADLAREAGAEHLVLTHLNPLYSPRLLLREAQSRHPHVTLAAAGTVLEV